jgi:hypothetical protein
VTNLQQKVYTGKPGRPRHIDVEYQRPWMYPKQEAIFFDKARVVVCEASTKAGKTVGCIAWLVEQALLNGGPNRHFWWVAPVVAQARIAFSRVKSGIDISSVSGTSEEVPENNGLTINEARLEIRLLNGSIIEFKSADNPDSLFGEDVFAAVMDEASRCREESWYAVRTTLTATQGPIRIIGNVRGKKNWAYRLGLLAKAGEPDMSYYKLTAYDAVEAGVITASEVESAKRQLPEAVWRELYLAEPSEDSGNPFGLTHIRNCIAPLSKELPRVWGWDLAKAHDWTVGIGLDREWHVSRFHRWQHVPWPDTRERIMTETGTVPALVDASGVGDPVVDELQRDGWGRFEGYKFSLPAKQELIRGLILAIQSEEIRFPDGVIVAELELFEYQMSDHGNIIYAASDNAHDDCVVALALAVLHARKRRIKGDRKAVYAPRRW